MMLTSPGQLRPLSSTARSAPIAPGIVSTTSPVTSGARFSTSRAWTQPFFIGSCQNSIELSGSTRSRQRNRYSRTASFMPRMHSCWAIDGGSFGMKPIRVCPACSRVFIFR